MKFISNMEKHSLALQILSKKLTEIGGEIFSDFFIRNSGNEEAVKSIQANDFMLALMTGKNIKEEWKLENTENYKKLSELSRSINLLVADSK